MMTRNQKQQNAQPGKEKTQPKMTSMFADTTEQNARTGSTICMICAVKEL